MIPRTYPSCITAIQLAVSLGLIELPLITAFQKLLQPVLEGAIVCIVKTFLAACLHADSHHFLIGLDCFISKLDGCLKRYARLLCGNHDIL